MKKVLSLVLVCIMMMAVVPSVGAVGFHDVSLDGEWDFKYYANSNEVPKDVASIVFEDKIQVPGAMELQGYGYPSYYYEEAGGWGMLEDDGVRSAGVYKTEFQVTENNYRYIRFENVADDLVVYLDGEKIGESRNGAIGTILEAKIEKGKHTLILVVKRDKSGINKADDFALSGLMGSVYVSQTNKAGFTAPEIQSKNISIKDNLLVIDGKEVVLKGIKYTPTHPETGRALTDEQIDKDIALIKEYGFNAIWVSCAPEYFYRAAAVKGLYVIDEANVNLSYAERDMETAKSRVTDMVKNHQNYINNPIIMWSVGSGEGNSNQLIEAVKKLDNRPVAQEVTFAPDFEIFGNTGGMAEWVETLGEGNVGGFVDEFADKELYYTQPSYLFETKDSVTGETVTIDGEVENYMGSQYLGDASYVRDIEKLDKYTIVTELSAVDGDRVIFESGNVKFEVRGGRARFNVGDKRVRADVYEGKIAAVYMDGEIQLFVNDGFKENAEADAAVEGSYTVGGGDTAIKYVEIYNDALTLDELLEGADEKKLVSRVAFDDINIKKDNSYQFLAYGGDFGDNPNSYYKCLTGIFSSTREPHSEAEMFRILFTDDEEDIIRWANNPNITYFDDFVEPVVNGDTATFTYGNLIYTVDFDGKITSIKNEGKELLTDAMYPTVHRENTLSEYEMGVENYEEWRRGKAEVVDRTLYIELISTVTEGKLHLAYSLCGGGFRVSMQSEFADDATKPTFLGFRGAGDFDKVLYGGSLISSYPDRRPLGMYTTVSNDINKMGDNYAVPQENGNFEADVVSLYNETNSLEFVNGVFDKYMQFQILDYSPQAMENADHDEDIVHEDKAYFRIGGYIAGITEDRSYDLTENVYGFDFLIQTDSENSRPYSYVTEILIDGEKYNAFATGVKNYVYRTNEKVAVTADGCEVVQDDKKAVIGDYTVYFAPDTEYLSDMTVKSKNAEIALDGDFNGNTINMRGNGWEPGVAYDKGVTIKNGSVTYDVSNFTDHVFTAVIGKNDMDWRKMGGGFDRSMFDASATVSIALDGVVVEEIKDVSMRSGSREINIDVSNAKEMTITVTGSGRAPQYEDAVLANAAFVPAGPVVVNFEQGNGKATITVLNTDKEYADVVLTATENGVVTTEATSIGKGLYKTVEVKAGEGAVVKAYVTEIGEIVLE